MVIDVEQVVYFQPIWLEVIDFMWEGVLGTAVWGGSAESGEFVFRDKRCVNDDLTEDD